MLKSVFPVLPVYMSHLSLRLVHLLFTTENCSQSSPKSRTSIALCLCCSPSVLSNLVNYTIIHSAPRACTWISSLILPFPLCSSSNWSYHFLQSPGISHLDYSTYLLTKSLQWLQDKSKPLNMAYRDLNDIGPPISSVSLSHAFFLTTSPTNELLVVHQNILFFHLPKCLPISGFFYLDYLPPATPSLSFTNSHSS